ncbi:MAG: type II toxin-antitoxin system RelE/ParE family toxin [Cyclobacteriaceae bacterium]
MSYKVDTIAPFRKEAKKLIKKYPSLKNELAELGSLLSTNPTAGTALGNNCYKIRLAIASKGKGKSGGARVITHFYVVDNTIFLLSIYDKSYQENISDSQIKALLKLIQ